MEKVQKILDKLAKVNDNTKGSIGEAAAFAALRKYKLKRGDGFLINTLKYPYIHDEPGNVKQENKIIYDISKDTLEDEVDIVLATPYRIFLIEVKSYREKVRLTDNWTYHGKYEAIDEKNVMAQAEKHARHFYHTFFETIPKGDHRYIIPLLAFVDKAKVSDQRSSKWKAYVPCCILNNMNATIAKLDTPLKYKIDLDFLYKCIEKKATEKGTVFL